MNASAASRKARAALADAGLSLRAIAPEPRGRAHHVFRAETDEGEVFVKVSGSPRPRLATERAALSFLAAREIAAPETIHATDDLIVTRSLGQGSPIAGQPSAWGAFGAWLRELHDLDPRAAGLRYDTDPLPLSERLRRSMGAATSRLDGDDARLAETLATSLDPVMSGFDDLPAAFVHRDLRRDNILVDPDGSFLGVVDFEHAAVAPPAWDLVKVLGWNEPGELEMAAFREGYGPLPDAELVQAFAAIEAVTILAYFPADHDYVRWARSEARSSIPWLAPSD